VFSSNYSLYGDMSRRLMASLEEFTPALEVYSIDEAFLDLTGFTHLNLEEYGHQIRQKIHQWTGLPISVGIGASKTLAKIANRIAKRSPSGVFNLLATEPVPILAQIPIEDVWGIGRQYSKTLNAAGISTALALRDAPQGWIKQKFGVTLLRTVLELAGTSCIPLELAPASRRMIICSRSFGRKVTLESELREAVATYTSRAAEKLRQATLVANIITVSIRTNRYSNDSQYRHSVQIMLPVATDDTTELINYALQGLASIYRSGFFYQKAEVMLLDLVPKNTVQPSFSCGRDRERYQLLMETIDVINRQLGAGTLQFAATGLKKDWWMRTAQRSSRYTSHWEELPIVHT
jgi:DNA polymerase V